MGFSGSLSRSCAAALLLACSSAAPLSAAEQRLTCDALPGLIGAYLQNHVQYHALDLALKERVAESHLRALDPGRSLLLEEDAEAMRKSLTAVFASLTGNDCELLESMHRLTVARYREMQEFVREYVSRDDYEVDRTTELLVDPDERGFPATKEEREDLYRRMVHFQMSNYLANGTELEEAKQKLIHRYELSTRRAEELEPEDIYARFLGAFAASLDPHSAYLSAENLEDFQIHMGLSLEGIGAVLSSRDGYTVVEEIVAGGAADLDGRLAPKDKILAVGQADGELVDVIDMDLRDVVGLIRGKKGTVVRLSVLRQAAETETFLLDLTRDKINLEEQRAKLRFEKVGSGDETYDLAVIELDAFYGDKNPSNSQATADIAQLLKQVNEAGADGLLLDLSRNGGGLLDYAVQITGYFLGSGGVVAVGDGRQRVQVLDDPDRGIRYDGPLVVLTSRVTASAGEILAGAIKDYRRGVIVGDDHTFGKGSVQTVAPLSPGLGALKLTTALFFRPGGASTQQTGVAADVVLPSLTATDDFGEIHQPYSLPTQSIRPFAENGEEGSRPLPFEPLSDAAIASLRERSAARVAESEDFAELAELLAKAEAKGDVVRVAEILEKVDARASKDGDPQGDAPDGGTPEAETPDTPAADGEAASDDSAAKDEDEETPSPQLAEALKILADLVATRQVALNAQTGPGSTPPR